MIKNYFKVAIRNLLKRKGFTLINVLGLATGMTVCMLIVLFIQSELSYDTQHKKGDSIYRVALERYYPGRSTSYAIIPQSIGEAIKTEYPEVLDYTRVFNFGGNGNFFLKFGDKVFEEKRVMAVDTNFFNVFTANTLFGDAATALAKPNSAVVTETAANKYFGSASDAVGKEFKTDGNNDSTNHFVITAVVKDWPENSHFLFDILLSDNTFPFIKRPNYINFSAQTYLLLNKNASYKSLEAKFPEIIKKYVAGEISKNFAQSWEDFAKAGNGYRYFLQPLKKIHLISDLEAEFKPNGSMTAVYMFAIVAVFILFLACINFVNLSTARSVERAKEVGIRKTFGSERKALMSQFLTESVIISFISMLVAFGLIVLLLPVFNKLSGKEMSVLYFLQPQWILIFTGFAVVTGFIAGLYPAFILSSFNPIEVLKGRFKSNRAGLMLRNGLVVFQFAISVILIIATIVVNYQMTFMLGDKLGFKKDHVIVIERTDLLDKQLTAFKTEVEGLSGVQSATGTSTLPGNQNFFGVSYQPEGTKSPMTGRGIIVDEDFAKTLGLELKEGRFFSKDFSTDTLGVVLNERAVKELGLTKPIGARLTTSDDFLNAPDGSPYVYTVLGVVKDFHFHSLHEPISPLVFSNNKKFGGFAGLVALRINGDQFKSVLSSLENSWKKFVKERPFHYYFLDQSLADQYKAEQTTQKVFTIFSVLAIFIACIGLLGLAAYATHLRKREISIRKVLGASTGKITTMLSADFLKLVIIASVIAFPVAWLVMNKWLQDFAYRVNIAWWIFAIAGTLAVLIALFTISMQAIKAAVTNPVKSLRTE
ncbi:MAG: ABC transporter permease [Sphingobacteriales bacterium]|nr:ABC transporter permease [Sphingobacteriales bacterium]